MSHAYNYNRRYNRAPRHHNSLNHSDHSDRTEFTRYHQGSSNYGGSSEQYYYENGNQLDYSDSDRTPHSRGYNSPQSSFNSGVISAQQGRSRNGSINSGYSDAQSVQSYGGGDNMSQASSYYRSREGDQRSRSGNDSICGSTASTTVAHGGRGRCPYQIGFNVQNTGKQMMTSKRLIHFRFGFANAQALAAGKSGVDCRGEEHDLTITWSITGGKRQISIDGREIQYTAGKRANSARRADIIEAAWKMSDHVFELKCYAYPPKAGSLEKRNPKWKQYNLTIDGRSFFELPEIFDLGMRGMVTGRLPSTVSGGIDSSLMSSKIALSSSIASTQYTDQSSIKSSIQSRIEQQRKLMNKKKQDDTRSRPNNSNSSVTSDLSSSNLMSFRSLRLSEDQDDFGMFSSGIYSAEPSELKEMRNRQSATSERESGKFDYKMELVQQSSSALPIPSAVVPQCQERPQQRKQSNCLPPTIAEPSSSIVTGQVQKQVSQQGGKQGQDMSTHLTLAPQQPPTYEEITQALVPSASIPSSLEDAAPVHSQQLSLSKSNQLQTLSPSSSRREIPSTRQGCIRDQSQSTEIAQRSVQLANGLPHSQIESSSDNLQTVNASSRQLSTRMQRSALPPSTADQTQNKSMNIMQQTSQPRAISSSPFESRSNNESQGQPVSNPNGELPSDLPKGMNKFAFF